MKKSKILFTAIMAIAICVSLMTGATYALFTGGEEVNVAITSGTIEVDAKLQEAPSLSSEHGANLPETVLTYAVDGNTVSMTNMVPGDVVEFSIGVYNKSSVTIKYQTIVTIDGDDDLYEALEISVDGVNMVGGKEKESVWETLAPTNTQSEDEAFKVVSVKILLPIDAGNDYQGKTLTFCYAIKAVQGNVYTGPTANIRTLAPEEIPEMDDMMVFAGDDYWGINFPTTIVDGEAKVAAAYEFSATQTYEEALASEYANWVCDFVIECDSDVALGELGLAGAFGAYENGTVIGFANPVALNAGEKLGMLSWVFSQNGQVGPIPYADGVVGGVGVFGCGLFVPYDGAMSGKTVTVSLVMANYEAIEVDLADVLQNATSSDEVSEAIMGWIEANYNNPEKIVIANKTAYKFA